jgi:hypothetical protein
MKETDFLTFGRASQEILGNISASSPTFELYESEKRRRPSTSSRRSSVEAVTTRRSSVEAVTITCDFEGLEFRVCDLGPEP